MLTPFTSLGKTLPRATMAALTMQVTLAPGQDVGDRDQELNPIPEEQVFDQHGRREDGSEDDSVKVGSIDGPNKDSSASVIARTKPLVSRTMAINGTRPKLSEKPTLYRKPKVPGPFRFNTTRVVPGGRKFGPGPLKKLPAGQKKKAPIVPKKPQPGVSTIGDKTIALTVRDPQLEVSSTERWDAKIPAIMSGTDLDTNRQSSSEEPTVAVGSKEQPDVGMEGHGNDTVPLSSEPTGTVRSQEKKCMNKVKVTHFRLPLKDRGSGCKGGGTVLAGKTPSSYQGSSETDDTSDLKLSSAETDLNYSPDPLHKLLTDTFDSLNITTFSVHLSESDMSNDAETVRKQILGGLKPLSSFPSGSSSLSTSPSSSHSSSSTQSSAAPSTSLPSSRSSSSSSLASPSLVSSSSIAVPSSSLTDLVSSSLPSLSSSSPSPPSSLPSLSPSPPSSSLSSSDSVGNNEPDVDHSKSTTDVAPPEDRKVQPSGKGGVPLFRRTPAKSGYVRRPHPDTGSFQNKTHLNFRAPHHSPPHLNLTPGKETETRHTSKSELLSSASSSISEESSSVEVNAPVRVTSGEVDGAATPASSGVQRNQKKMPTERGRTPVRRLPPNGGYLRRPFPNFGPLQNQTRPNMRLLPPPSRPLNPATETRKEQASLTELPVPSSPPVSKESYPAEGTGPIEEENEDRVGTRISTTSMSTEFNQTLSPSSHHPVTKDGYFRRPHLHGGRFQNKTRTNLRPPHHPYRGPMRKPFPARKLNGSSDITVRSQTSQLKKASTPEIIDNQSGEHGAPMPTQGVHIRQSGRQNTVEVIPSAQMNGHDTTIRPQTTELEEGGDAAIQTTKTGEEEIRTLDSNSDSDIHKERVNAGKNTGATSRGSPTIKRISSDSRHGAPRPVTLPKRLPTINTEKRHYMSGSQRREDTKTNDTAKSLFDHKTEQTRIADSKPVTGSDVSSGVTREPLDYVGVTNRTSDGFTLVWDSPEEKYRNFVVTRKEVRKVGGPKQKESKKDREEEQEDSEKEGGNEGKAPKNQPTKEMESENGSSGDENRVPESIFTQVTRIQSSTTAKPLTGTDKTFKKSLPGSARSFQFDNLPPQTEYTVTLLGKGPGLLSRLHKLVISTGTSHCDSRTLITTAQYYNTTVNVVKSFTENLLFISHHHHLRIKNCSRSCSASLLHHVSCSDINKKINSLTNCHSS